MKKLTIIPLTFILSGCPGDRNISQHRYIFMHDDIICFSINKNDVLNYYRIESSEGGSYHTILSKDQLNLSYPDTCIKPKLRNGYKYHISYDLNNKHYSDSFFIDNDGNR